jgi:hypothetical protein
MKYICILCSLELWLEKKKTGNCEMLEDIMNGFYMQKDKYSNLKILGNKWNREIKRNTKYS